MSDKKEWLSDDEIRKMKNELNGTDDEPSTGNDDIDDILKNSLSDDEHIDEGLLEELLNGKDLGFEEEEKDESKKEPVEVRKVTLEDFSDNEPSDVGVPGLETLFDVPIDIRVILGSTEKTIEEILDLKIDSIMKLSKLAGEPVEVIAGNQVIAKGETVIIDDRFGVLITEIIPPKERIKSVKSNLRTLKN